MGIFSNIGKALGFGSNNAGSRASEQQQLFNEEGIAEIRKQLGITSGNLQPFATAGVNQLPALEEGATVGGFDQRLQDIFNTDIFGSLVDKRTRAVEGQLSAGGLTRSGTAIEEAANIPTEIALMIEEMLTGRSSNLANQGQNAASNLGQFSSNAANNISRLKSGIGLSKGQGILSDEQSQINAGGRLLNTISGIPKGFKSARGISRLFK